MASDDGGSGDNKRLWPRQRCGTTCTLTLEGIDSHAQLLDASRGGFKLRFEHAQAAMAALLPLPRDIIVTGQFTKMHATVMWASNGLAGCRFYQHLSLDEVVELMTSVGGFNIQIAALAPPEPAGGGASQSEPEPEPEPEAAATPPA
ncbi:MAG: PilZ domain-containing protein [Magnetospirillum sp.]|nr:PilZ domain-containing protein [Magnetospirillum sp.]